MRRFSYATVRVSALCSIAAMATVIASAQAQAQEQAPPAAGSAAQNSDELQDIVVTARKVAEKLQDVPVTITAYTGAELNKQNAVRLGDVGRLTPSITFRQSSTNPSGLLISMRGQFQRDTIASLDPSVGTYVDGVYWARAYGINADLVDLKSAQILKGPQGTLFGRNTTGGAVVIETNDPQYDSISGVLSGQFGRFNERAGTAVLNVPIINDVVALRGAVQFNKRDGYIHDIISGRTYDNRDTFTGRLKLGIKPTDNLNIIVSGEMYNYSQAGQARFPALVIPGGAADTYATDLGPIGGMTLAQFAAYTATHPNATATNATVQSTAPVNFVPDSNYKTRNLSGTVSLQTGIGTFKLIGGYRSVKGHSALDLEGTPWAIQQSYLFQDLKQYSGELQLTGKVFDNRLSYAAGGFGFKETGGDSSTGYTFTGDPTSANATVAGGAKTGSNLFGNIDNKSAGVYGQSTFAATDRLHVTGGLRYSADTKGASLFGSAMTAGGVFTRCFFASLGAVEVGTSVRCTPVVHTNTFHNVSYLVSADYKVMPDVLAYIRFSKGYRSGGQNLKANSAANYVPFGPELVYDLEAGFKSEFFNHRLRFNASGYRDTIVGAQRTTIMLVNNSITSIYANAAKARVWGLEAELTAVLGGGFQVSASGALTRAKYLHYTDASGDRSHERFNGTPREQFSIAGNYGHEFNFAKLDLHMDYGWASATPLDELVIPFGANTAANQAYLAATTQPAGGEANARASLSFDNGAYEVALYGRNIFDRRVLNSALGVAAFGYVAGTYTQPATYGVQATIRFGH